MGFNTVQLDEDVTWNFIPISYAACCEIGTFLIAACIPGLRPLWLHHRGEGPIRRKSPELNTLARSKRPAATPLRSNRKNPSYKLDSLNDLAASNFTTIEGRHTSLEFPQESFQPDEIKVTRCFEVA